MDLETPPAAATAESKSRKLQRGRSVSGVSAGGGLAVGIATVIAVGVVGKLFSKWWEPRNDNSTTHQDAVGSLDKIIRGEGLPTSLLKKVVSGGNGLIAPLYENERAISLNRQDEISGREHGASSDLRGDGHSITSSSHATKILIGADSSIVRERAEDVDSSMADDALSELVSHAFQRAKHEDGSKQELVGRTKALQEGIAEVISRAFEEFQFRCEDVSDGEFSTTELNVRIPLERDDSETSFEGEEASVLGEPLVNVVPVDTEQPFEKNEAQSFPAPEVFQNREFDEQLTCRC